VTGPCIAHAASAAWLGRTARSNDQVRTTQGNAPNNMGTHQVPMTNNT
jgi:hypothetical protein